MPALERFGRFEILRRVDSGGMAEVLVARERLDEGTVRLVALKRLLAHLADDPEYVRLFRDEARLALLIDHPNVCRAFGSGVEAGQAFITMEWIHGVSLAELLERARAGLPLPVALHILVSVADAVHFTHALKDASGRLLCVVHRDISPPNIMIGFDGSVKILDFGLAKSRTQSVSTVTGLVKGKLRYLAPEQLEEGAEIDWRIDLFSLGLCGYEALTGRPLFDHDDPIEAAKAIQAYTTPPSILAVRPDVPPAVEPILARALARAPEQRYPSAMKMKSALRDALGSVDPGFSAASLRAYVREQFPVEAVSFL